METLLTSMYAGYIEGRELHTDRRAADDLQIVAKAKRTATSTHRKDQQIGEPAEDTLRRLRAESNHADRRDIMAYLRFRV